jgi:hypothetical protein
MSGGILQLVAYGAQDLYLTGQPQITFFKTVYRRHTMFSMESIRQTFNGTAALGSRVTSTISRNGDLLHRLWVTASLSVATLGRSVTFRASWGHALLKTVELEIGGQRIDKHYSEWLQIWSELTMPAEKQSAYNTLVGVAGAQTAAQTVYVPLQFWFCRNVGLALPLIALQYHEVKINIEFGSSADLASSGTAVLSLVELWADYIYLDVDERKRFAQVSHEYLIDQLQFVGDDSVTSNKLNAKLNFNHPVKELVWYLPTGADLTDVQLKLNGHDRFAARPGTYFAQVQPFQHHTRVPSGNQIYVYSFALKPEEHQPSGTCNFSRIDNASLQFTSSAGSGVVKVFAVNYNILRVISGMGGIAYSN